METKLLCPCEFQLVLVYNRLPGEEKGREIEPEVLEGIFDQIVRRFGSYTPLAPTGPDGGVWKGIAEPSIRIEIAVPIDRVTEVRQFVYEIGEKLGQEEMYFKALPPCVELIKIEPKKA